jgi:uncharacterized protein YecE (DUF72 family)
LTVLVTGCKTERIEFNRAKLAESLSALAKRGVFVGTSSWKYPGWLDQLYTRTRYEHKGKLNERNFKSECLREYGEVFKTVGVDATYYAFPNQSSVFILSQAVPDDFLFVFKAPGDITIKKFSHQSRFGQRAGEMNKSFLDAELFKSVFLKPIQAFADQVGLLMFEFSRFYSGDYQRGRDFLADLDRFLTALPGGWPYGVEIRNRNFLKPEYFEVLRKHGVAHVFNNWSAMPTVGEQLALEGSLTNPKLCAARFLLKPGRKYQEAVDTFAPYKEVKALDPEARAAGARLMEEGAGAPGRRTFVLVNNRLEGNALGTIRGMIEQAEKV